MTNSELIHNYNPDPSKFDNSAQQQFLKDFKAFITQHPYFTQAEGKYDEGIEAYETHEILLWDGEASSEDLTILVQF